MDHRIFIFNIFQLFMGLLFSSMVLYSVISFHKNQLRRCMNNTLGSLVLVVFSFLWALLGILPYVSIFMNGHLVYEWCQFFGIVMVLITGGTMAGHMILALERFYWVLHSQPLKTDKILYCWIGLFSIIIVSLCMQFTLTPYPLIVMESEQWCFLDFTSTHPIQQVINGLCFLYCMGSALVITGAYANIYMTTRQVTLMRYALVKRQDTKTMTLLEKTVFHRCLLISGTFALLFTPTFIGFLYRWISRQSIPVILDYLCVSLSHFDCILTPILVCFMQSDIRQAVMAQLPLEWQQGIKKYQEAKAVAVRQNQNDSIISTSTKSTSIQTTACSSQE